MEKKKTIFDYMSQVLIIYGITILILNVFCMIFGEDAKEMSTMFALGKQGLPININLQFFLIAILVVVCRFVLFTDFIIKNMSLIMRTVLMYVSMIGIVVIFNFIFGWFPSDVWLGWVCFIICFAVCAGVSTTISYIKDKQENDKMQRALEKWKQEK